MKGKETLLLLFVGICAVLVVATVVGALEDAERTSAGENGQRFSASISATATVEFDFSDLPTEPDLPAQFDEGAPLPTAEGGG